MTTNKVEMKLVGMDGNAFAIMGNFQRAARKAGWNQEEISAVLKEAQAGDYNHLLATIMEHVEEPFGSDEDEESSWDEEEEEEEEENEEEEAVKSFLNGRGKEQ